MNALQNIIQTTQARMDILKKTIDSTPIKNIPIRDYNFYNFKTALIGHIWTYISDDYPDISQQISSDDIQIEWVDRSKHGADITIKITRMVSLLTNRIYISEFLPGLSIYLSQISQYADIRDGPATIAAIYLNFKLTDITILYRSLDIYSHGDLYGSSDFLQNKKIICEYSSPNMAKNLHAGHIRSTVIGHILANIIDQLGARVYRCNHLNDRGGVGQLIQGYIDWKDKIYAIYPDLEGNDFLTYIYTTYRQAEKIYTAGAEQRDISSHGDIARYIGDYQDYKGYKTLYTQFKNNYITRFQNLEKGEEYETNIWQTIRDISVSSFDSFYDKLDIHIPFTLGESFYLYLGQEVVQAGLDSGTIVKFQGDIYDQYKSAYIAYIGDNDINPKVSERKLAEIDQDMGSYVCMLDDRERYVVMRSDGASIYATRDLGCIYWRIGQFAPDEIIYEVGQEQADHFDKLFASAKILFGQKTPAMKHISHGFYVNATDRKKLSSRDGASSVYQMIDATIDYFKHKYDIDNRGFTSEQIAYISHSLGISSILINDIRKDRMSPVLLDSDIQRSVEMFEQSGGAYLIYTTCRARSILDKAGWTVDIDIDTDRLIQTMIDMQYILTDTQLDLIKKVLILPEILHKAYQLYEPSVLVDYIYQLTQLYNSFYAQGTIIGDDIKLYLTYIYQQTMQNCLYICNIQAPSRI